MGGKTELDIRMRQLDSNASRSMQTMANIYSKLTQQEKSDSEFLLKYPDWSAVRSTSLLVEIQGGLQQMKDAFQQAQISDNVIKRDLDNSIFIEHLRYLSMSREDISKLLPSVSTSSVLLDLMNDESTGYNNTTGSTNDGRVNTNILENKLIEMAQIIDSRQSVLAQLETLGNQDISQELLTTYITSSTDTSATASSNASVTTNSSTNIALTLTEIVDKHLLIAQDTLNILKTSYDRQNILLKDILKCNEDFQKACINDPIILSRNKIIKTLEETIATFFNIITQISAGITFYTNFQSRLTNLQQSADDLVYTQQLQRQEYEHNLAQEQLRFSQVGLGL